MKEITTHSLKKHRLSVSLPESAIIKMNEISAQYDISMSWLARHAITYFLDKHKDGEIHLPLPFGPKGRH